MTCQELEEIREAFDSTFTATPKFGSIIIEITFRDGRPMKVDTSRTTTLRHCTDQSSRNLECEISSNTTGERK